MVHALSGHTAHPITPTHSMPEVADMISYSDTIRSGLAPGWYNSFDVTDAVFSIQQEFGDTAHTRGRPDYVVRELINQASSEMNEDIANSFFLIVVNRHGLTVIEKIGAAVPDAILQCDAGDDWLSRVVEAFRAFRRRLAEVAS